MLKIQTVGLDVQRLNITASQLGGIGVFQQ